LALAAQTVPPLTCPAGAHDFLRINIYNGKAGGEEYDLAPDAERKSGRKVAQVWNLKGYRSMPIFVRCQYRGTDAVTNVSVPAEYRQCRFTFELDKQNEISGKPVFFCK
jgi:hypothetical protein